MRLTSIREINLVNNTTNNLRWHRENIFLLKGRHREKVRKHLNVYVHISLILRVCLVCKTVSTRQNSTKQNNTTQGRTTYNKFLLYWIIFRFIRFLKEEMLFWCFRQLVRGTKSCVVVWWGTKISVFVLSLASRLSCP